MTWKNGGTAFRQMLTRDRIFVFSGVSRRRPFWRRHAERDSNPKPLPKDRNTCFRIWVTATVWISTWLPRGACRFRSPMRWTTAKTMTIPVSTVLIWKVECSTFRRQAEQSKAQGTRPNLNPSPPKVLQMKLSCRKIRMNFYIQLRKLELWKSLKLFHL